MRLDVDRVAVERELAAYLEDAGRGPPQALDGARTHSALPLWTDLVGCLALRPTGELIFFSWDDPRALTELLNTDYDRRLIHAARALGSRRYPGIAGLAPAREASARICPTCHGSGRIPDVPDNVICECGGLGWVPQ